MFIKDMLNMHKQKFRTFAVLGFSSLACAVMAFLLRWYTQRPYIFLLWNLFLAWIPLFISFAVYFLHNNFPAGPRALKRAVLLSAGFLWLLFYPNASYIVTDLIHWKAGSSSLMWYDLLLYLSVAWLALVLGFISLYLLQELIASCCGKPAGWLFVLGVSGLSSFGIYLGRFLRFNSWDIFTHPAEMIRHIFDHLNDPYPHPRPLSFSLFFLAFSLFGYLIFYAFAHLHEEMQKGR
ncbi:MAG: DUF1361 domain-containing protein [Bacillota bacterium]